MGGCGVRVLGLFLMAIGGLLIVVFVPFQVWLALIGAILAALGFVLWRCFP